MLDSLSVGVAQFSFTLFESFSMYKLHLIRLLCVSCLSAAFLTGCGTVIGLATDTVIAVAKVPFKVAGAVVDVATGDEDEDKKDSKSKSEPSK